MRWLGPGLAVVGFVIVGAVYFHSVAQRSMLERGAVSVVLSYERALPLLGLGCALAVVRPRPAALGALLTVVGLWLGLVGRNWLIAAIVSGPTSVGRLALPGPISCLAAGLVLAAPERLRPWLLSLAAIVIGAMLALGIKLIDPSFHDPRFLRGAIVAGIWLVAAVALTGRLCNGLSFRIAMRIFGSWLVAIGLMLGASILVPRAKVDNVLQPPPETLEQPELPGMSRKPTDPNRRQLPSAPPRFDPLRQP